LAASHFWLARLDIVNQRRYIQSVGGQQIFRGGISTLVQAQKDSILTPVRTFIAERLRGYIEEREEFSRTKYEAVLHSALRAPTQKQLAKQLGVSYDVLRQWHSQPQFAQKVDKVLQEFAVWVGEKLDQAQPPVRFGDVSEWGEIAARAIAKALERRGLKLINNTSAKEVMAKLPHWKYPRGRAVRDMMFFASTDKRDARALWHDLVEKVESGERDHAYKLVVSVLRNPGATSDQRKEALRAFEVIVRQAAKVQSDTS
jgi:hypothetical protein